MHGYAKLHAKISLGEQEFVVLSNISTKLFEKGTYFQNANIFTFKPILMRYSEYLVPKNMHVSLDRILPVRH